MIFCILKVTEDFGTDPDPHQDPLARGTDPWIRIRIRICTKMSRIRNTAKTVLRIRIRIFLSKM
jgi:hypothetical protein